MAPAGKAEVSSVNSMKSHGFGSRLPVSRATATLESKGLLRHVNGTAKKPVEVEVINDKTHQKGKTAPMTDNKLEEYYTSFADFEQKEAQVRDIIYETIPKSVFLQVKGQASHSCGQWLHIFCHRHG